MTVVVGLTSGALGRAALTAAVEEATFRNVRLLVVNANRGDRAVDKSIVSDQDLSVLRGELDTSGVAYEVRQPVDAEPIAETLIALAIEEAADLIVIGVRRRTPVGKLLLGSTASQILLGADCPVLAVKAPAN